MTGHTTLYRMFNVDDVLLYVGISTNPAARMSQHRREQMWWADVRRTTMEHFSDRRTATRAERDAIVNEQPLYNVHHGPGLRKRQRPRSGETSVDPDMAERLRQYHYPTWVAERDAVVVEALEAGGSLREVADLVGLTGPGVMKIRDRLKGQGK